MLGPEQPYLGLCPGAPMGQRAPFSISQPGAVVPAPVRLQKCWSQLRPVRNLYSHPDFWSSLTATFGTSMLFSPWGLWDGALEGETCVFCSCFHALSSGASPLMSRQLYPDNFQLYAYKSQYRLNFPCSFCSINQEWYKEIYVIFISIKSLCALHEVPNVHLFTTEPISPVIQTHEWEDMHYILLSNL